MGAKICNDPTFGEWIRHTSRKNLPSVTNHTERSHKNRHEIKSSIIIISGDLKKKNNNNNNKKRSQTTDMASDSSNLAYHLNTVNKTVQTYSHSVYSFNEDI
jgi:hypothetical protein